MSRATRQNLGGRHERRLPAVFHAKIHGGGGNDRFAAPHIPDDDAPHGDRLPHVRDDFIQCFFLRIGQCVGQGGEKGRKLRVLDGNRRSGARGACGNGGAEGEGEEFVENQPPFGDGEVFKASGGVNLREGKVKCGETVVVADIVGQNIARAGSCQRQRLGYVLRDLLLGKSVCQRVDRA